MYAKSKNIIRTERIIEDMRKNGYKAKDICEAIGISSYDYQRELILGFWWRNGCVPHNKRI